ncbi:MAG: hypothetical protein ACK4RV_02440 [Caulobacter sp.]
MSQFDYFFGFYSIVLGLSVVELLSGFARLIETRGQLHGGSRSDEPIGRLTLLLAGFLALDLSSYWLQAWQLYRGAPLSMTVMTHGLVAAGAYFVAAYLVFPRQPAQPGGEPQPRETQPEGRPAGEATSHDTPGEETSGGETPATETPSEDPDAHFWTVRRWVFGLVLLTNVLNVGTLAVLHGGLGFIGPPAMIAFIASFYIACAIATAAPRGRAVVAALVWLVVFSLLALTIDAGHMTRVGWRLEG